jgi:hypothetical protein
MTDAKYSFIRGALRQTYFYSKEKQQTALNHGLDYCFYSYVVRISNIFVAYVGYVSSNIFTW